MPDPRRLFRRVTESSLPTRVIAHLSVVSLVAVASLAGLSQTQAPGTADADSDFLALVQSVRGAGEQTVPSFEASTLGTLPDDEAALLDRSGVAVIPDSGPMPTPVPVDPDATPLPAPQTGVGETTRGPTTRTATPAAPVSNGLVWPVPAGSISQYYHAGHLALDIAAGTRSDEVRTAIAHRIASGEWRPGQRLPSERRLGDAFGVSRVTIRKALTMLVDEGADDVPPAHRGQGAEQGGRVAGGGGAGEGGRLVRQVGGGVQADLAPAGDSGERSAG